MKSRWHWSSMLALVLVACIVSGVMMTRATREAYEGALSAMLLTDVTAGLAMPGPTMPVNAGLAMPVAMPVNTGPTMPRLPTMPVNAGPTMPVNAGPTMPADVTPEIAAEGLPPLPPASAPPPGATVGMNLSQFRFTESKVNPPGRAPEIQNIQQVGAGVFKMVLRMGNGWHDGDRDIREGNQGRKGRAELCCLGGNTPYKWGKTYVIGSTIMFHKNFVPSKGYCQIGQPLLHQSYFDWDLGKDGLMRGRLMVFERGLGSRAKLVRECSVPRGQWLAWKVKVTIGRQGYYGLSVNGDPFKGIQLNTEIGHVRGSQVGQVPAHGGTFGLYLPMNGPPRELVVYHAKPFFKQEAA